MPSQHPRARVEIDADLDTVWAVMLDVDTYGEWNPFCFKVECPSPPQPGEEIKLHVRWANGFTQTSPERISQVVHPYDDAGVRKALLGYVYEGLPSKLGLVKGERLQELSQAPGGPTVYETVELFSGPLVALVAARVQEGFQRHAAALKVRAEGR